MGSMIQANRQLLSEFSDKQSGSINRHFEIHDQILDQHSAELNLHASILCAVIPRIDQQQAPAPAQIKPTRSEKFNNAMMNRVVLVDGIKPVPNESLENTMISILNENFKNSNNTEFTDDDVHTAFLIGKMVPGRTRTVKLVLKSPWVRCNLWSQREKLKGKGLFISDEPSPAISKIGFEAREARRRGVIKRCKTLSDAVLLTLNNDEVKSVDTMEEFMNIISAITAYQPQPQQPPLNKPHQPQQQQPQQPMEVDPHQQNPQDIQMHLIQALKDKGLIAGTVDPNQLLQTVNTSLPVNPPAPPASPLPQNQPNQPQQSVPGAEGGTQS